MQDRVARRVVEIVPRTEEGAKVRVNVDLQDDFSMNQTLSLFVHDTIPLMDPQAPDYSLVLLTLAAVVVAALAVSGAQIVMFRRGA